MADNSERPAAELSTDLAALRQDIGRLTDTISELVQHQARAAAAHVSEAMAEAKEHIAHGSADARGRLHAASGDLESSIKRNPVTAVLIAFAIGMSFGMFSRPRG
ncbi:MAG TPA: hypothetical protein VMB71_11515 [Acetobacteraceae bacterium]|nr:hypothetical protein [Acetobacteraceae bacterium]